MNIYAIGTSHRYSPVEVRERLAFGADELPAALEDLCRDMALEASIVSTCNRTEVYVVPRSEEFHADRLKEWLRRWKGVDVTNQHLFQLHSCGAAKHLFEVASGVDSQVIGDIQIIGQVKEAYQAARQTGALGKLLSRLFTSALHTGKRVKSETDLFAGAASISYAAVELARKIFYPLGDKKTLVVGAGDTGELTARSLRGQGVKEITITNRTEVRGLELIERLGFGRWMPMGDLAGRLHEFDIVIVSTGAPDYVIDYEMVRAAAARRGGEMQLIVDISVPRNVDPKVETVHGVFCKDLDDLNNMIDSNLERRKGELPRVQMIIDEELARFSAWCNLLPVTPVIAKLQRQTEEIIRAELTKNRHRFSEGDFDNVEKLVQSVVKKIIGMPMAHLLDSDADIEDTLIKAEYISMLFNLGELENGANGVNGAGANGTGANGADGTAGGHEEESDERIVRNA